MSPARSRGPRSSRWRSAPKVAQSFAVKMDHTPAPSRSYGGRHDHHGSRHDRPRTSHEHEHAHEHAPRLALAERVPEFYRAMIRLETAAAKDVDPTLYHLIKIRASQVNRCAFCLDMHTKDALAEGETVERIVQLTAWEESGTSTRSGSSRPSP
ncbi:hypothetical protein SNARM312S_05439 [Streptomyces narbonensis]